MIVALIRFFFQITSTSIGDTDDYGEEDGENCEYDDKGCDQEKHLFEVCEDEACHHNNFRNLPKIIDLPKFSNFTENKECCHGHGYLHVDNCPVFFQFKYQTTLVKY